MQATIKKWGNSYALRLTKRDLEKRGLREGQAVVFEPKAASGGIVDLSGFPVFHDPDGMSFEEALHDYYVNLPKRWRR